MCWDGGMDAHISSSPGRRGTNYSAQAMVLHYTCFLSLPRGNPHLLAEAPMSLSGSRGPLRPSGSKRPRSGVLKKISNCLEGTGVPVLSFTGKAALHMSLRHFGALFPYL